MFRLKTASKLSSFIRNIHSTDLIGKVFSSPEKMTADEIKSILWTAIELRQLLKGNETKLENIKGAKVTFIMKEPSIYTEIPAMDVSEMLGVNLHIIVDPLWDTSRVASDTLKFLQTNSDVILVQSKYQNFLDGIKGLKVPLFNVQSVKFKMSQCLSDFMTIQMKYGQLRGLKIAWLGPPNRTLNTYLCLAPKLGMNISFCCSCKEHRLQSPIMLNAAKETCEISKTCLEECTQLPVAVKDAKIIAISRHMKEDSTSNEWGDVLGLAHPDCSVLCELPRQSKIESDLTDNERCLIWESAYNMKWILAAIMIKLLVRYDHQTDMPKF